MWALNSNNQEFQAQIPISVPDFTDTQPTQNQFGQTVNHEIYAGEFSNKTLHVSFLKKKNNNNNKQSISKSRLALGKGGQKEREGETNPETLNDREQTGGEGGL